MFLYQLRFDPPAYGIPLIKGDWVTDKNLAPLKNRDYLTDRNSAPLIKGGRGDLLLNFFKSN
jgi:hypothetical protein